MEYKERAENAGFDGGLLGALASILIVLSKEATWQNKMKWHAGGGAIF
jgi:hypothetical protein